jgi:enamine deaminase RidA (YjgF/YER057c/UK114 family)
MTWRSVTGAVLVACMLGLANCPAAEDKPVQKASDKEAADASVQYLPLDAPAGMSQAVVVQGHPLVHTRQLLPLDREGKLVGGDSVDKQVEQVLNNLDAVLSASGSSLGQLVRLNVYAIAPTTVDRVREQLSKRLDPAVRPTITAVLTPLPHRDALVAVDAVAVAAEKGKAVAFERCEAVAGDKDCADAAVLPRGGVAYLSGVPAEGGLTVSAVDKSMSGLWKTLKHFKLTPADVVQLKVFLRPASSADEVLRKLKEYFPGQMTPPVVFVEWLAPPPVEIELIAQLPLTGESAPSVQYYNPPEVRPMQIFSRVALVRTERQIYVSSLFARKAGRGQEQALDVFDQLQAILEQAGSDLRHMAKATYYACDDDSARGLDRARLWLYDQDRPPAASKCMVHGVGQSGRTLTMDMIAVGTDR